MHEDSSVYHGLWECQADMERDFEEPLPDGAEVLFATYDATGDEGDAFVLFRQDGALYEVNGSHCSCYGLEGQWSPEKTTLASLRYIMEHGYKFSGAERQMLAAVLDRLEAEA